MYFDKDKNIVLIVPSTIYVNHIIFGYLRKKTNYEPNAYFFAPSRIYRIQVS